MWGWLGNLTELRELWLDDNPLTGGIPSKLVNLDGLTHLYLGGRLSGCVPPPLLAVPDNNLDQVNHLRPCPSVFRVTRAWGADGFVFRGGSFVSGGVGGFDAGGAGIYWYRHPEVGGGIVFDMPVQAWLSVVGEPVEVFADRDELLPGEYWPTCLAVPTVVGTILIDLVTGAWVAFDHRAAEACGRHVPPELPQYEDIFDQLTASLWRSLEVPW